MAGDREQLIGSKERKRTQNIDGDQDPDLDPDHDQERLAHLSAFGIVWESLKLCYWRQARYFFAILFTLGVPFLLQLTVTLIFYLNFFPHYISSLFPPPQPQPAAPPAPAAAASASATGNYGPIHGQNSLWMTFYSRDLQIFVGFFWPFFIIFGVQILTAVVSQVCRALWLAGTTYTVGLFYFRQRSSSSDDRSSNSNSSIAVSSFIQDVLRQAPRLWYRLMRTWLWEVFLLAIPFFIYLFSVFAILSFSWSVWLNAIPLGFFMVCAVVISIIAPVAEAATVLDPEESCYGLGAFKKGMELLKDKWRVAIGVFILWVVISFVIGFVYTPMPLTITPGPDVDPWDPVRILHIVIYCIILWVVTQANQTSSGVLYASLKAYHGESIAGMSPVGRTPRNQTPASHGKDGEWV